MEIDPNRGISEKISGGNVSVFSDLVSSIPGIDEAMGFSELMKQVRHMKYDVIVFDTAPTGHTLKFLRFPSILEKGISKMIELKSKFSGLLSQISSIFSENENLKETTGILAQLEETKAVVEAVNDQFQNPELTTFVSVCIPEFLSVFETSRLIAALNDYKISCENLIVNQVLFPEENSNCSKCKARIKMQRKYLEEIDTLFDDCSIVTTPLMDEEVRGLPKIEEFSNFLVEAFQN
ncbi:Golgi to ER traffic-related protein, variant 2 [Bonamia ostreae]